MSWWQIAIVAGLVAPWVVMGGSILIAFRERGIIAGFGIWAGSAVLTVPLMLFIMWIGSLIF